MGPEGLTDLKAMGIEVEATPQPSAHHVDLEQPLLPQLEERTDRIQQLLNASGLEVVVVPPDVENGQLIIEFNKLRPMDPGSQIPHYDPVTSYELLNLIDEKLVEVTGKDETIRAALVDLKQEYLALLTAVQPAETGEKQQLHAKLLSEAAADEQPPTSLPTQSITEIAQDVLKIGQTVLEPLSRKR